MNAKEFYVHLREADHTAAATPEELAQPALTVGARSSNPFENVLGKLSEATRIIGELFQVIAIGKQILDSGVPNHPLQVEYDRRLVDLGVTRDDLGQLEVIADPAPFKDEPEAPTPRRRASVPDAG